MGWRLELTNGGQVALSVHRDDVGGPLQHRLSIYGPIVTTAGPLELKGRSVDVVLYLNNQELAELATVAAERARVRTPTTERGGTHGEDED
jgi:hypothetical protein